MKSFLVIALLAVAATAAPEIKRRSQYPSEDDMTVDKAQEMCGNKLKLHCCNKYDSSSKADDHEPTILGGLIGSILGGDNNGLLNFDQCSPLGVAGIPGGGDLLNSHCKAQTACCQSSPSTATGGLVNLALPCFAIGNLVG